MSDFVKFRQVIQAKFAHMQKSKLFVTNVDKDELWQNYLNSFPEGTNPIFRERTEHDCSCCRRFVKVAGNIVIIKNNGALDTIWDVKIDNPAYQAVADSMAVFVKRNAVAHSFSHYEKTIGTEKTFEQMVNGIHTWEHFFFTTPNNCFKSKIKANKERSEEQGTFQVIKRSFEELTDDAVETVLDLIEQGSLYRGSEHLENVKKFNSLKSSFNSAVNKDNFVWSNIENKALRIRNTAIGTLLIDLSEGLDLDQAVRKYESVVAPANYKRPKPIVSKKQIEEAKKILEDAGLISSLDRRVASIKDIPVEHLLFLDSDAKPKAMKDVFDDMSESVAVDPKKMSKVEKIAINDFIEKVIPKAKSIEILVESRHKGNAFTMTAPQDFSAPTLFKWDNPFAWGYVGNVTDSIKERVKAAGGRIDADVCCRLAWHNSDDLDLHMIEPSGSHISFRNKMSPQTGGQLDIDMNAGGVQNAVNPVENIYYSDIKRMKPGTYRLFVNQYSNRNPMSLNNYGFTVEVEILGEIHTFNYSEYMASGREVGVCEIVVKKDSVEVKPLIPSSLSSTNMHGMKSQTFSRVKAIMLSPNYWKSKTGNKHYFFVVDGCGPEENPRGIYNEFIREDIGVNKRVFELLGSKLKTDKSKNPVVGFGFSATQRNSVFVRVEGSFTRTLEVVF